MLLPRVALSEKGRIVSIEYSNVLRLRSRHPSGRNDNRIAALDGHPTGRGAFQPTLRIAKRKATVKRSESIHGVDKTIPVQVSHQRRPHRAGLCTGPSEFHRR